MALAVQTSLPVLISAAPDRAMPLAIAIAASAGANRPDDVLVVESTTAPMQMSILLTAGAAGRGHRVVVLRNIETFDPAQQLAVIELLEQARRPGAAPCRVIATTSVALFERVADGSFDPKLFYKLNAIHLKP